MNNRPTSIKAHENFADQVIAVPLCAYIANNDLKVSPLKFDPYVHSVLPVSFFGS